MKRKITILQVILACSFIVLHAQIPDPLAKWSFEETGGGTTIVDSGANNLDGSIISSAGVIWENCGVNQSINFLNAESEESRIIVPDHSSIDFGADESFTISCLAFGNYAVDTGNIETGKWLVQKGIIHSGAGNAGKWFGIEMKYFNEHFELRFAVDDRTVKSVATLRDFDVVWDSTQWHHIVGMRDRTADSLKIYMDGILVASQLDELIEDNNTTTQPLNIGNNFDGTGRYRGAIDEVAIYDVALSASEVNELYNSFSPTNCTFLSNPQAVALVNKGIQVYPIPANRIINVQLDNVFLGKNINITDITGRIVLNTVANNNLMKIDVSELSKGLYFISVDNNSNTTTRIVIE